MTDFPPTEPSTPTGPGDLIQIQPSVAEIAHAAMHPHFLEAVQVQVHDQVISVFGVASAAMASCGKAKSDGVNTAAWEYCMSMFSTFGRLPTLPEITT